MTTTDNYIEIITKNNWINEEEWMRHGSVGAVKVDRHAVSLWWFVPTSRSWRLLKNLAMRGEPLNSNKAEWLHPQWSILHSCTNSLQSTPTTFRLRWPCSTARSSTISMLTRRGLWVCLIERCLRVLKEQTGASKWHVIMAGARMEMGEVTLIQASNSCPIRLFKQGKRRFLNGIQHTNRHRTHGVH